MTIGAPKIAVAAEMDTSVGAKSDRAIRSQNKQNIAPPRNAPGMTTSGFDVPSVRLMMCGTAMPTKLMGPANAVTVAASRLDSKIRAMRNTRMLTPALGVAKRTVSRASS